MESDEITGPPILNLDMFVSSKDSIEPPKVKVNSHFVPMKSKFSELPNQPALLESNSVKEMKSKSSCLFSSQCLEETPIRETDPLF